MASSPTVPALARLLVRGGFWAAVGGWASEFANLALFFILARLLGPTDFGIVALAGAFTAIATGVVVYAITQVILQKQDLEPEHCDAVFLVTVGGSCAAAALFTLSAPAIASFYGESLLARLVPWLSLTMPLQAIGAVPLALLSRELRFGATARRTLLMILGGSLVGVTLAWHGYGPWALVAQHLVSGAVGALVLLSATDWRPGLRCRWRHVQQVWGFVAAAVATSSCTVAHERAPFLVIGYALGPAATGVLSLSVKLVDVLTRLFATPINQVPVSGIAAVQDDPPRIRQLARRFLELGTFVAAPAFLGAAVLAPLLIHFALGERWAAVGPVFQILALRGLVWPHLALGQCLLYGVGRPERMLRVNRADLAVDLVLLVLAAPFGLLAVARLVLWRFPLTAREIYRATGLRWREQATPMLLAGLAALIMGGGLVVATRWLEPEAAWLALLAPPAGCLSYIGISALFNRAPLQQCWRRLGAHRHRKLTVATP